MNFRRACHKLKMYQRRHDQRNRKKGYHTTISPFHKRKWLRGLQLLNGYVNKLNQQEYEEYHKQQRQQLAAAIKQLTLEPQE